MPTYRITIPHDGHHGLTEPGEIRYTIERDTIGEAWVRAYYLREEHEGVGVTVEEVTDG